MDEQAKLVNNLHKLDNIMARLQKDMDRKTSIMRGGLKEHQRLSNKLNLN